MIINSVIPGIFFEAFKVWIVCGTGTQLLSWFLSIWLELRVHFHCSSVAQVNVTSVGSNPVNRAQPPLQNLRTQRWKTASANSSRRSLQDKEMFFSCGGVADVVTCQELHQVCCCSHCFSLCRPLPQGCACYELCLLVLNWLI